MQILELLDELRAMGRTGVNFADDPYDEVRYRRLLELVDEYYGQAFDVPPEDVRGEIPAELGQVTPKVGADAAVFDEDGRVLLVKRSDSGTWCLPGGATGMDEPPEETAVREIREETGLAVDVVELVDAYRRPPSEHYPYTTILLSYLCTVTGGDLELSHEGEALEYWEIEAVPEWFPVHREIALDARGRWEDRRADSAWRGG